MTYNIWAEGFLVQGMEGIPKKASFVGQSEGNTFAEACENWYKKRMYLHVILKDFFILTMKVIQVIGLDYLIMKKMQEGHLDN